jgi:hypothetical protein
MPKIIFWNIQRWSDRADQIADQAEANAERAEERRIGLAVSHHNMGRSTGPMTRGKIEKWSKASNSAERKKIGNRWVRAEIAAFVNRDRKSEKAALLGKKARLPLDLANSGHHVFFCEVQNSHPQAQSPLRGGDPAGNALCYAYYRCRGPGRNAFSTLFLPRQTTDQWYGGRNAFTRDQMERVPRGVVINVESGNAKGTPARFCFWHAPSRNNASAIVVQMANRLNAGGQPFVLFGDLNAEPHELLNHPNHQLAPGLSILNPGGPTHDGGKILDYVVTNVLGLFSGVLRCRSLHTAESDEIKSLVGSDHMAMILELL